MALSARSLRSLPVGWGLVALTSATLGAGVGVALDSPDQAAPAPVAAHQPVASSAPRPAPPAAPAPAARVDQSFRATFVASTADSITVQGVGAIDGTPDVAVLGLEVSVTRDTSGKAMDAANAAVAKVFSSLRHHGVAAADIQSTGLSLYAQYDYPDHQRPTLTGYRAGQSISVKLRSAAKRGATISAVASVSPGDVAISGLSYDLLHDAAFLTAAQQRAFAAARKKAEQYAGLAHRRLGRVMTISELRTPDGSYSPYLGGAGGEANAVADVPLAAGSQSVQVSVTVTWALR